LLCLSILGSLRDRRYNSSKKYYKGYTPRGEDKLR
jgi:hypothetical protein